MINTSNNSSKGMWEGTHHFGYLFIYLGITPNSKEVGSRKRVTKNIRWIDERQILIPA